jgi:hypothetical protein
MRQVFFAILFAGVMSVAWASSPFNTICAGTVGAKTLEIEAGFGMNFNGEADATLFLPGLVATFGINDKLDVGASVFDVVIPTADGIDASVNVFTEIYAKFAAVEDFLAFELGMPINFWDDAYDFGLDITAAVSLIDLINVNAGVGINDGAQFNWGVALVPSFGPIFVGAEICGSAYEGAEFSGSLWRLGAGVGLGNIGISAGFGGNFATNAALNMGIGFSIAIGGN